MKKAIPFLLLLLLGAAACQQDLPVNTLDAERSVAGEINAVKKQFYDRATLNGDRALTVEAGGRIVQFVGLLAPYKNGKAVLNKEAIDALHEEAQEAIAKAEDKPYRWIIEQQVSLKMLEWVILKSPVPVDEAITLYYVDLLVESASAEFSAILAALDNVRGHAERVEALAAQARINRQALSEIAEDDEHQGSLRDQLARQDLVLFDERLAQFAGRNVQ